MFKINVFDFISLHILNTLILCFFLHRGLFIARDHGESGWSHDFMPVCDLETCADLGLTNDYLLNLVSFGMDQDGMWVFFSKIPAHMKFVIRKIKIKQSVVMCRY